MKYLEHAAKYSQEIDKEIQAVRDMVSIAFFVAAANQHTHRLNTKFCCSASQSIRHQPEGCGGNRWVAGGPPSSDVEGITS